MMGQLLVPMIRLQSMHTKIYVLVSVVHLTNHPPLKQPQCSLYAGKVKVIDALLTQFIINLIPLRAKRVGLIIR